MFSKASPLSRPVFLSLALFILAFTIFTRFAYLDWGAGYFFHPDESNLARSLSQLSFSSLHPHFFAYGQFPLYFSFFFSQLLSLLFAGDFFVSLSFSQAVFALRFLSASFSSLSVLIAYNLARRFFSSSFWGLFFAFLLASSPGLIQAAHFGTTESLLVFSFLFSLYLSFLLLKRPTSLLVLFSSLSFGLALGSKLTGLFTALPPLLSLLVLFFSRRLSFKKLLSLLFFFSLFSLLFTLLFTPHSFLSYSEFISSMRYEISVATAALPVFYTRQFLQSKSLLFPFQKIFPYSLGLPALLTSFLGLLLIGRQLSQKKIIHRSFILIFLAFSFLYFLSQNHLFTRWIRFYTPLLPLLLFFSLFFFRALSRFSPSRFRLPLFIFFSLPIFFSALSFFQIYASPDSRLVASDWLKESLPEGTRLLSEAGNVINLPFPPHSLEVDNFDFYSLDQDPVLAQDLALLLFEADYLLVPSRRMFMNQTGPDFPFSTAYYDALFSGRLGFTPLARFQSFPRLKIAGKVLWETPDEEAEETWTVFDHPVVRLFQKTQYQPLEFYENILFFSQNL